MTSQGPVARSDVHPPSIQTVVGQSSSPAKYSYMEIGHEIISTAILSLPPIQVE